jgi:integrase
MAEANHTEKKPLTPAAVKAAKATGSVYRLRDHSDDPDLKGFHLVVSAKGAKTWTLAFTSPETGDRRFYRLGAYPGMTLADARREARRVRQEKIQKGIDPAAEQERATATLKAAREEEAKAGTVKDVCETYVLDLELDGKRSAREIKRAFNRDVIPKIGELKARDVTPEDLADALAPLARRAPVQANRVRSYLVAAFNIALKARRMPRWRGRVPDFGLTGNPALEVERTVAREKPGTRSLSPEEIARAWTGFEGDKYTRAALRLQLATGQRVEEVLHATWSEFDLEAGAWVIPAARRKTKHKSDTDHVVPLNGLALEVLKSIPHIKGVRWLFPRKDFKAPRPNESLAQAVRRWCEREAFEPFTPRDLRRTWKQAAGRHVKLDLEIRNRIQGHAFSDIGSQAYDGLGDPFAYYDDKREAMAKWNRWLKKTVTGEAAKVVPLRQGGGQ